MTCGARGPKNLTRYVIMKLSAIVCNFRLGSASAITYPLNKWLRAGKSNKKKEEKMDTSIDKPVKRPVPKPITGQFPKRGANGQFLRGASGNPQRRPLGSRNRASLLRETQRTAGLPPEANGRDGRLSGTRFAMLAVLGPDCASISAPAFSLVH